MIHIGIDAGVTGAVAAIYPGIATVADLPICERDGAKLLDAAALIHQLRAMASVMDSATVYVEDIRVRQIAGRRMSHSTETTLVGIRYAIEAVCQIARIQVMPVQPRAWKHAMGLTTADKAAARTLAISKYPTLEPMLRRVKDHNRAESLLIAEYGRMVTQ